MLVMVHCLENSDKEINVCLFSTDTIKHILFSILGYFNLKLKTHRQRGGLYWLFGNMLSDFLKNLHKGSRRLLGGKELKAYTTFRNSSLPAIMSKKLIKVGLLSLSKTQILYT